VLKFVFIIDAVADLTQKGKSELNAYVRDFPIKVLGLDNLIEAVKFETNMILTQSQLNTREHVFYLVPCHYGHISSPLSGLDSEALPNPTRSSSHLIDHYKVYNYVCLIYNVFFVFCHSMFFHIFLKKI